MNDFGKKFYDFSVVLFDTVNNGTWNLITTLGLDKVFDFYGSDFVNLSYGATSVAESILRVYNTIIFVELILLAAMTWIITWTVLNFVDRNFDTASVTDKYPVYYSFYKNKQFFTSKVVEFFWTLLPVGILFFIGYPSLVLLYLIEERVHPEVIVKVIGHQWYWTYENDSGHLSYISLGGTYESKDEFFEYVKFPIRSGLMKRWYPFVVESWIYDQFGVTVSNFNDLFSKWNHYCLVNSILNALLVLPITDKASMESLVLNDVNNYGYIVDFDEVTNSNEFFATDVLSSITDREVSAVDSFDPFDINSTCNYYLPFNWVERAFEPFNYKYLWLDIDFSGDISRYLQFENLLSFDRFNSVHLDGDVFDSYLLKDYDLLYRGEKRMLEVDNRLVLPARTHIQLLVTSADVIHSFAVPAFGIKIDAIPGRLNQCFIFSKYEGTFFGQCSELCGVDHGYMPIAIEMVSYSYYFSSIKGYLGYHSDLYYSSGWETLLSN